ncbi:hypothetical protein V1506DRAFT_508438 [Lipomyces tetrasporus]
MPRELFTMDYYVNKALEFYRTVLRSSTKSPPVGMCLLYSLVQETQDPPLLRDQLLLIIAYIGHGAIDIESNRLQFISENGCQKML